MGVHQEGSVRLAAGTYGSAAQEGIHLFDLDLATGAWTRVGGVGGIDNPSFVAAHPAGGLLFAVSETDEGAVVAYRYDAANASLAEINRQPSEGDAPCHLHVDASGRWLLAVNYMSGGISVYPIAESGSIGPLADRIVHDGTGPRADRQESAHPHSIFPIPGTNDWLVSDLGTDGLYIYRLDAEAGKLAQRAETRARPGSGPRHVAFHPTLPIVYLIEELACAVTAYRCDPSQDEPLAQLESVSTLPASFDGDNTCADIHLTASGRYLYASNRGHDSLAIYRVGDDGRLEPLGHASTGGRTPRNFAIVGDRWLLAANQDSDSALSFKIGADGGLTPSGHAATLAKPVCLQLLAR